MKKLMKKLMKKKQILIIGGLLIVGGLIAAFLYYSLFIERKAIYMFCQTTADHEIILEAEGIKNEIPTNFVLLIDKPNEIGGLVYFYPSVPTSDKDDSYDKTLRNFKIFKENIAKEKPILTYDLFEKDSHYIGLKPLSGEKNYPHDFIYISRFSLTLQLVVPREVVEALSGKVWATIATCVTWHQTTGKSGKNQI